MIEVIGTSSAGTSGQRSPNISRLDLAVQLGHRVGPSGQAQAHDRHVEALVGLVAGPVAERHQLVEADAHLAAHALK